MMPPLANLCHLIGRKEHAKESIGNGRKEELKRGSKTLIFLCIYSEFTGWGAEGLYVSVSNTPPHDFTIEK